jgi:hypothetical protein
VAELADALGSGSSGLKLVGVRVPPSAPPQNKFPHIFLAVQGCRIPNVLEPDWSIPNIKWVNLRTASITASRLMRPGKATGFGNFLPSLPESS